MASGSSFPPPGILSAPFHIQPTHPATTLPKARSPLSIPPVFSQRISDPRKPFTAKARGSNTNPLHTTVLRIAASAYPIPRKPSVRPSFIRQNSILRAIDEINFRMVDDINVLSDNLSTRARWTIAQEAFPIDLTNIRDTEFDKFFESLNLLENSLEKQFENDFKRLDWHGSTSLCRIFWQNKDFLKIIQNPSALRVIFSRKQLGYEREFGPGVSISSMLLSGLANNRIAYLITASPNWINKPAIEGMSWESLRRMDPGISQAEFPLTIDPETLQLTVNGLQNIKDFFDEISVPISEDPQRIACDELINSISTRQLIICINNLLKLEYLPLRVIEELIQNEGSAVKSIKEMTIECHEVLREYESLLKSNLHDHGKVLGYGIISRGLDSLHLLATFAYEKTEKSSSNDEVEDRVSVQALQKLILGAFNGFLGEIANQLVRIRIQEILSIILKNHEKMPLLTLRMFRELLDPKSALNEMLSAT